MPNLLFDKWLPAETSNGDIVTVAPIDVPGSNFLRIAHARADYSALATELLIDLFQTICAPKDQGACAAYVDGDLVPTIAQFSALRDAFELTGEGPRFLQTGEFDKASVSVSSLFFEAPGGNTVKLNKDFFVSRDAITSLCQNCAPLGLYLVQSHARMGGAGYQVGPRATSALAAIVEGDTLWETICLNLLPVDWFDNQTGARDEEQFNSFPWMNRKLDLDKKGERALAEFGRFGVLWWTPLMVRLNVAPNTHQVACAACGEVHPEHIESLSWKATAAKLAGAIRHPRTGWNPEGNNGAGRAREVPAEGFTFEHWQALTVGSNLEDSLPAWQALDYSQVDHLRLRLFGYAMKQNTPVAWLDETTPIFVPQNPDARNQLRNAARTLLEIARSATRSLGYALKPEGKASASLAHTAEHAKQTLWTNLEPKFVQLLQQVQSVELNEDMLEAFRVHSRIRALRLFDQAFLDEGDDEQVTRQILARRTQLTKYLSFSK